MQLWTWTVMNSQLILFLYWHIRHLHSYRWRRQYWSVCKKHHEEGCQSDVIIAESERMGNTLSSTSIWTRSHIVRDIHDMLQMSLCSLSSHPTHVTIEASCQGCDQVTRLRVASQSHFYSFDSSHFQFTTDSSPSPSQRAEGRVRVMVLWLEPESLC